MLSDRDWLYGDRNFNKAERQELDINPCDRSYDIRS